MYFINENGMEWGALSADILMYMCIYRFQKYLL